MGEMAAFIWIPLVALSASLLTFFSGFGLGTLLSPVFMLFFPLDLSIAMTGIVHLLNNLFKLSLVYKYINRDILLRFGVPALLASFVGAYLLVFFSDNTALYSYSLAGKIMTISWIKIIMGALILFFALMEIVPALGKMSFGKEHLLVGGLLSGFFGGLSGHQGALRSAFLIQWKLSKEAFIATGVAIACLIDIVRLSIYSPHFFTKTTISDNYQLIIVTTFAAFIGAYLGNKLLKKVAMQAIQYIVTAFLFLIALSLMIGLI